MLLANPKRERVIGSRIKARGLFATCQDWLTFAIAARTNVKAKWHVMSALSNSLIQLSGSVRSTDRTRTVSAAPLKKRGSKTKQLNLPLTPAGFSRTL